MVPEDVWWVRERGNIDGMLLLGQELCLPKIDLIYIYNILYAYKIQYHIMNYIGDPQLEMQFLMIFHGFFLMASLYRATSC